MTARKINAGGNTERKGVTRIMGITLTGRGFEGMKEKELRELEDTRAQARAVNALRKKCNEIAPKGRYRSPAFDGMPGGKGEPCGLDGGRRECEALLEELEREEKKFARMIGRCEKIIERSSMTPGMRGFVRRYFFCDMSVKDTMESMGMSEDAGWKYKRKIYGKSRKKRGGIKEKSI